MKVTLITVFILSIIAIIICVPIVISLNNPTVIPPLKGIQQGLPLIPSDAPNSALVGGSVGLSFNGNTLVMGGNNGKGAWIFTRTNSTWSQETVKLIGSGASGSAFQGFSVAISSLESKTILSSDTGDNSQQGATWVFVQSNNNTWNQQGNKLVGSDSNGSGHQGQSLALSYDGNTALIGSPLANGIASNNQTSDDATWVFVRSNGTWTQQGNRLLGTGVSGSSGQGQSVALSSDGNTAMVGGIGDNNESGAAWIFVRSQSIWTQQGNKLVGSTMSSTSSQQGWSVSLSSDGNTAMVGGIGDGGGAGAVWVFVRSNQVWTQQGPKLLAIDAVAGDNFGSGVSLDALGNTSVIGANRANNNVGKFYIFSRTSNVWTQVGSAKVATGLTGQASLGSGIALSGDSSTAAVGAIGNNNALGAVVVFV